MWQSLLAEVESSRTSLASRTSSKTDFEVLGLGLEGQVLGLEASSPRKLACPRLEDSTIFWIVKILWSAWKNFWKTFFCEIAWKIFVKGFFFFLESTCACVLGPWPWPRAFLSLASRVSLLGKAVLGLGLGFFFVSLALASSLVSSTPPLFVRTCIPCQQSKIVRHNKPLCKGLKLLTLDLPTYIATL